MKYALTHRDIHAGYVRENPTKANRNQQQRVSQNWFDSRMRIFNLKSELAATIVALALRKCDRQG